ncbi:hypothetical protein RAS12_00030 [Achromobacter seleniivolatilans]|uniref:Uncharacterized protein n=1 Tax=Achromobacter seleniivolatilans TaxID=3047478 RepID=A0ABY9M1C6_9BURK|nr:hypothetical protein [Achromobacter sp. R39]WMD20796.1 hypothetical protein RAS12_00030 [Achromobacter sp. R39]
MNTLTIAPIGTCRVHTPLRSGVGRYPISLSLGRNYGFVHTSAEALQQVNYMFGRDLIPAELQPLIFRPNTASGFDAKAHVRADMYFVELSSRKLLEVDGIPIQLNYVARRYQDFFASKSRSRMFWSRALPERLAERREWLLQDSVYQRLDARDADLLSRIVRRDMTDAEIERDMAQLVEILGQDKIVFVTHVNADTPDGLPIEPRRLLIQAVKASARRLKVACYDPSALMKRVGQLTAMENDGLDLAHYTESFSDRLCADMYKRFIAVNVVAPAPVASEAAEALARDLPEQFAAQWAEGHVIETSRRLHDYVRRHPDQHAHRMLLGEIRYELGDYEGACAQLEAARASVGANEKSDRVLMQAYFNMGAYEQARTIAVQMLAEEIEAPDIVRLCAVSAERLHDTAGALVYWKRLFRLNGNDAEAADAALAILGALDDLSAAEEWVTEVLETMPSHPGAFAFRWERSLERRDREGLLAQADETILLDEGMALALAQRASAEGHYLPAAMLAQTHHLQDSQLAAARAWIAACTASWKQLGSQAFDSDDLGSAADYLQSTWRLKPTDAGVIRARRALGQKMRRELRQAFIGKDYRGVFRIAEIAHRARYSFAEFDSLLGRAHFALGDFGNAFIYLKKAMDEDDVSLNERVQYARAASRSDHFCEALAAYLEILKLADEDAWAHKEATRELARLEVRSVRAARELSAQGNHAAAGDLLVAQLAATPQSQTVRTGIQRLLAALKLELKSLAPDSADRRLALGIKILKLDPDDEAGLRAAAIGAMRTYRFTEALGYWSALRKKTADPAQIDLNIQKCQLWIARVKRKSVA